MITASNLFDSSGVHRLNVSKLELTPEASVALDQTTVAAMQDLINQLYGLVDHLLAAVAAGMGDLNAAAFQAEQERSRKQFEAVQKQMEMSLTKLLLKIFMPLLMAIGIMTVAALPIDPVAKGILIGLLTMMLAANIQESVSGGNFIKSFFEVLCSGNAELAQWLSVGFEALVGLVCIVATLGSIPKVSASMANLGARIASLTGKSSASASGEAASGAASGAATGSASGSASGSSSAARGAAGAAGGSYNAFLNALSGLGPQALKKAVADAMAAMSRQMGRLNEAAESFSLSNSFNRFKSSVLTYDSQKKIERFANGVMLLSGVVTGGLNIDKAVKELQLADIEFDVSALSAVEDALGDLKKDNAAQLKDISGLYDQFSQCMDTLINESRRV